MTDGIPEVTPAAREALARAYRHFADLDIEDGEDDFADAVFRAIADLRVAESDDLTPGEKFWIICTAAAAGMLPIPEKKLLKDLHPFSTSGRVMAEVVQAFLYEASTATEKRFGLREDSASPDWCALP